jgi:S1-C subfamily serine protease
VPRLKKGDRIAHPWLGVQTSDPTDPASPPGAEVQDVTSGGPADAAGLQQGDVITEIDGQPLSDSSDLSRLINGKQPGDHVDLHIDRAGQDIHLGTTLGNRPQRTP